MEKEKKKLTRKEKFALGAAALIGLIGIGGAIEYHLTRTKSLNTRITKLEGERDNLKTQVKGQQKTISGVNYQLGKLTERIENLKK